MSKKPSKKSSKFQNHEKSKFWRVGNYLNSSRFQGKILTPNSLRELIKTKLPEIFTKISFEPTIGEWMILRDIALWEPTRTTPIAVHYAGGWTQSIGGVRNVYPSQIWGENHVYPIQIWGWEKLCYKSIPMIARGNTFVAESNAWNPSMHTLRRMSLTEVIAWVNHAMSCRLLRVCTQFWN